MGTMVLALTSGGVAACGGGGPETVTVEDYTEVFCAALDDLEEGGESTDELNEDIDAAVDEGEIDVDDAEELIEATREDLRDFRTAFEAFRSEVLGSVPDDSDSEAWAEDLEGALESILEGAEDFERDLGELDTGDVADDPEDLEDVVAGFDGAFDAFTELLFDDDFGPNDDYGDITEAIVEECLS